jgi:hypothetical protein
VRGLSFNRLVIGLLFTAIVLTACLMPAQSDTFWHLRAGQDIWRTHHVPLVEPYSHTAAGRFWPNHEWLWQAVAYALYRVGGMPMLAGGMALVVTAAFVLAYRLMVGPPLARFVLVLLGVPVSACVWALRPQVASLALLALLVTLLARERYRWLPLLFVVWANIHGAVALGGAVLFAVTVLAWWRARSGTPEDRARARALGRATFVSAAATTLTPLGIRLWTFVVESIPRSRQIMINEWMPAYPTGPVEIAFWVLTLAFVVLLVKRWRHLRSWADVAVVVSAVVVLPLAIRAVRNIPPFLLLAIPAASRLLGEDFRLGRRAVAAEASPERPGLNLVLFSVLALFGAGTIAIAWAARLPMLGWDPLSPAAIAAVRACPGPLYNRYDDGGFLIWFAPNQRVFIDSRQDPYPAEFVYQAVLDDSHATPEALLVGYDIRCVFLPRKSESVPRLEREGWRSTLTDEKWAVLTKP